MFVVVVRCGWVACLRVCVGCLWFNTWCLGFVLVCGLVLSAACACLLIVLYIVFLVCIFACLVCVVCYLVNLVVDCFVACFVGLFTVVWWFMVTCVRFRCGCYSLGFGYLLWLIVVVWVCLHSGLPLMFVVVWLGCASVVGG